MSNKKKVTETTESTAKDSETTVSIMDRFVSQSLGDEFFIDLVGYPFKNITPETVQRAVEIYQVFQNPNIRLGLDDKWTEDTLRKANLSTIQELANQNGLAGQPYEKVIKALVGTQKTIRPLNQFKAMRKSLVSLGTEIPMTRQWLPEDINKAIDFENARNAAKTQ